MTLALFHDRCVERQGEKTADAPCLADALGAIEQDAHRVLETSLHLEHHLSAGAAGGDGFRQEVSLFVAGSDSQGVDGLVGILGIGIEQGGAFGTEAGGGGRILLVTACHHRAVGQTGGGADGETRVGGIATVGGLAGGVYKPTVVFTEFVVAEQAEAQGEIPFFHG